MITFWMKKIFPVILVIFSLIIVSAFLLATTGKNNKLQAPVFLKALLKEPSRPLPVYGFNGNNILGPAWTNKAYRDSAASLNFKIIRYPGGIPSGYWDWRKGWFVKDGEKGVTLPDNFKKLPYIPSGLNELKLLVDQTHCDVVFNLNMITKDLDDQIEMLKKARSLGIAVKWVELGNEFNEIGSAAGRKRFSSPREYGNTSRQWVSAIKENFPKAKVAVIGGDRRYNDDVKNWNNEVLSDAPNADAAVAHIYPIPANVLGNDGIDFEKLFDAFKQDYDRQNFNKINKNIWVTEFNIQWGATKGLQDVDAVHQFSQTWGQALATILMTSMATTLPKQTPQLVLDHNISNWWGFAAIATKNNSFEKLPNGIAFGTWCKVSTDKNTLRQISFKHGSGYLNDYEVLGWQFKNGNENSDLVANLTADPVDIDLSALKDGKTYCDIKYAQKNKIIKKWSDVNHERRKIVNNHIQLPPYSIGLMIE
jgi:hypothetical protein